MVLLLAQELEGEPGKSGISTAAPPNPKAWVQSLPPILRIADPPSMPSCSKAPRGLLVLARVTRIFTGIAISPSPSLRQRPDRYAIRAGRNLPDKEFRYLRHVCYLSDGYRSGPVISAGLCMSPCRSDHLFRSGWRLPLVSGVWSLRIPRRCRGLSCWLSAPVALSVRCFGLAPDTRRFQHIAGFCNGRRQMSEEAGECPQTRTHPARG